MSRLAHTEFSLNELVGGQPLSSENVDLPTLRDFLTDVEILIKGDVPRASLADSRARIENGSVKIVVLVAQTLAASLHEDVARLAATGDLDVIQPKRAQIVEKWQSRARRLPTRDYLIASTPELPSLRITSESRFLHGSQKAWVAVEKYLTGKVVDLGGKQSPNVHLVLLDTGENLRVSATEEQLAGEKENQLYKTLTIRVSGEQHLQTKALRNLRLIQFVPQTMEVDEQALASLWEKGRQAWKDVASAVGWVEAMRGNAADDPSLT